MTHYIGHPRGYKNSTQYPVLCGTRMCQHCLCNLCVIKMRPEFLQGFCSPHPANDEKWYRLYRLFWRMLNDLGLWKDEEYLTRKEARTVRHDKRDIMPSCVIKVGLNFIHRLKFLTHLQMFAVLGSAITVS